MDALKASDDVMRDREIIDFVVDVIGHDYQPFLSFVNLQPRMTFDKKKFVY